MKAFGPSSFYPIIKERWKDAAKINDESRATSLAGYRIKFPSRMPLGYSLQLGVLETATDDSKFVLLYYSKSPLADTMRVNEFFAQKGIYVGYRRWAAGPRKESYYDFLIPDFIRTLKKDGVEALEITINGHGGISSSQRDRLFHGVDIHDPSQAEFVVGKTHITIQGYLTTEELIQVAGSIK